MPTPLKRHNHRVHPCNNDKKEQLLELLLEKNQDKKIIVVSSKQTALTSQNENVSVLSDEELAKDPSLRCDMIISYDLPSQASEYIQRISHTDTYALILLDIGEEKLIHPIETLLGRAILQEFIEGFSEAKVSKQAQPSKKDSNPREERKRAFLDKGEKKQKPRGDKTKKPFDKKEKPDRKPWEKKEKKENKYLGKDENGKAIFSGKTGDRNHAYDGTPKTKAPKLTGKKISIKSLKKEK